MARTACAISSWRSKGNKCRSPRTRIHTPCFCSFSLIRKRRQGWDREPVELENCYHSTPRSWMLPCVSGTVPCAVFHHVPSMTLARACHIPNSLARNWSSDRTARQTAQGHTAIKGGIRTETQVCLILRTWTQTLYHFHYTTSCKSHLMYPVPFWQVKKLKGRSYIIRYFCTFW